MHTFWYSNMPNVTPIYGRLSDSDSMHSFLGIFIFIACLKRYNFIKLLQIVGWGRSVEMMCMFVKTADVTISVQLPPSLEYR